MEPQDQLYDKPVKVENGPNDGKIGKSLSVMQCTVSIFYCVYFYDIVRCIIRDKFQATKNIDVEMRAKIITEEGVQILSMKPWEIATVNDKRRIRGRKVGVISSGQSQKIVQEDNGKESQGNLWAK